MGKTTTYKTLLDKAETPLQTHILLGQLAILRKQDKLRNRLGMANVAMLVAMVVGLALWAAMAVVAGQALDRVLPFGH